MEADDKKRYWNDQIKGMLGPCMITFAIPLTVPGLTITLVAFSEDTTFETYGVIHIVGILFLATAVILLILGCMLRMLWKPTIGPDIEMHLTPLQSVASLRNHKKESQKMKVNNIYSGARVGPEERVTRSTSRYQESHPNRRQTAISDQVVGHSSKQFEETCNGASQNEIKQSRSGEADHRKNSRDTSRKDRRISRSSLVKDDSSIEETGSESETVICKKKRNRKSSVDSQGRGEHRHTDEGKVDERFPLERSKSHKRSTKQLADETCLDEIQQWRQKKKSKQRSKIVDTGIVNTASDCEDTIMSRPLPKLQLNERPLSSSNLENGSSTGEETNSGQSSRSPHQSLLQHDNSLEKKKRRKKKRASKPARRHDSTDNANDVNPTRVLPPVIRGRHQPQIDGEHHLTDIQRSASSDSINSIGSADSVLAQFTSRNPDE